MILVIDLMRNIFVIMFFILIALELIVLISLTALYQTPLNDNKPRVEEASLANTMEVLQSFNTILTRKYTNLETELILIGKHLYPMYLTQNNLEAKYPKFIRTSNFYRSFKDCLSSEINEEYNVVESLLKSTSNFANLNEDEIIEKSFETKYLNKISSFPKIKAENSNYAKLETYVCYSISIFKSMLIRNLIFEKENLIASRYLLMLDNKYLLHYPVKKLHSGNIAKEIPDYSTTGENCEAEFNNKCIDSIRELKKSPNMRKDIYFDSPSIKNSELVSRGCIQVKYSENEDFTCIDFSLSKMLKDVKFNKANNPAKLFLITFDAELNDFRLLYTNKADYSEIYQKEFNDSKFGDKRIKENELNKFSLFHGIYYDMYKNLTDPEEKKTDFLKHYEELFPQLNNIRKQLETKASECDFAIDKSHSLNVTQYFPEKKENFDISGSNYYLKEDLFQYTISPVRIKHNTFDDRNYIFDTACQGRILFYSLAVVRVGSKTIPDDIFIVLVFKSIRNGFFFVSLLLFATIVYFILCEIYVKFLLVPIKSIRQTLEKLIKHKSIHDAEEGSLNEQGDTEKSDPTITKSEQDEKGYELQLFRNKETKELEDLLNFLKKIVMMKQAQGNTDFKVQAKIYTRFLSILNRAEDDNYCQCLLIIAYSKYKDNNFLEACDDLNKLKKIIENKENDILSKNDSLEQKLINLPSTVQQRNQNSQHLYLNEFIELQIPLNDEIFKLVKLRIFNQKIYYLYGLIKFLDFYKRKQDNKFKSKQDKTQIMKESYKSLEEGVESLKKAYNINNTMNFNQIKSIFILILIARCKFYMEEYNEATNKLKEALLKLSDLNKFLLEKNNLLNQIDPRVMFITNGIIMEQILFFLGRICEKIGKKQLGAWTFNKLMEITYFRTNDIHRKVANKLYKFLFEKENLRYLESKYLLSKLCRRLHESPVNKKVTIIVSENLLKNFNSTYELKQVIIKCVSNYLQEFDLVSFIQFDINVQNLIEEKNKNLILKEFRESDNFCRYSGNLPDEGKPKTDFYNAMKTATEILNKGDHYYTERGDIPDKYIFVFLFSGDFKFRSAEENKELARSLIEKYVSVYSFCFDLEAEETKLQRIEKYLKDLVEGYLIMVNNFKIIKQAFQNISRKGSQQSVLQSNYENHKFIR